MPRIDGGLEIVTSDGEMAARLQRAVHRLSSEFSIRVRGELPEQALRGVLEGRLDSGERLEVQSCEAVGGEGAAGSPGASLDTERSGARRAQAAEAQDGPSNRWYSLIGRGGSGKDVRQLFERQGALVSRVLRTRLGDVALSRDFPRGRFRELTAEELGGLTTAPAEPRSSSL